MLSHLDEITSYVALFEQQLIPTLTERGVSINSFAKKIVECGIALAFVDNNNKLGVFVGYMNNNDTKVAYCSLLVVDKQHRGEKIGEKLLCAAEKKAIEKGMLRMKLEVRKANEAAIRFYIKRGYSIIGTASETSYYMEKTLDLEKEQ